MNKDNGLFIELRNNPEAKWVCDFLNKWENRISDLWTKDIFTYMQDIENMEDITNAAWKHYCRKNKKIKTNRKQQKIKRRK